MNNRMPTKAEMDEFLEKYQELQLKHQRSTDDHIDYLKINTKLIEERLRLQRGLIIIWVIFVCLQLAMIAYNLIMTYWI